MTTTIVTRAGKGSSLTWTEADANFTNLQTAIDGHIADTTDAHASSAIGFTQTGTGATTRTVESRLQETISPMDFGCVMDGTTDDTTNFQKALDAADDTVRTTQGNQVQLPQGSLVLSSTRTIPNRVMITGANKRGSEFLAKSGFTGTYMFNAVNGTSSMFDCRLVNVTLNCNDLAGMGGLLSDAYQEGGGLESVLIHKFRTYGMKLQNGYGGAASLWIKDAEIFGSTVAAATAGIYCDQISVIGNFMLNVSNSTIAGGGVGKELTAGIHMVNDSLHAQGVHFESCTSGIYLDGVGHHTLIGVSGATDVTSLVEIASTFTGSLTMLGCMRGGATNFIKDNRTNGLGTITSIDPGFLRIDQVPHYEKGSIWATGTFDGTSITTTYTSNVTSITSGGAGDYTVTLTKAVQNANDLSIAVSSNTAGGSQTVDINSATSFRIRNYNAAGALADSNEVKFIVARNR